MKPRRLAYLASLFSLWIAGCNQPCDNSSQCGDEGMCVASVCQALSCELTIFAIDPKSGECTPLSACYMTQDQMKWQSCNQDPCPGLDEPSCLSDTRCQPAYANPNVEPPKPMPPGPGGTVGVDGVSSSGDSGGCVQTGPIRDPGFPPSPDGKIAIAGVNNGTTPKHPPTQNGSCFNGSDSARVYNGCRAAPKITKQDVCETLTTDACKTRRDCTTTAPKDSNIVGIGMPTPVADAPANTTGPRTVQQFLGQCYSRFPFPGTTAESCAFASGSSCLLNPSCQTIGTRCYCPPGGKCDCDGGGFLSCEENDHLRRCKTSSDCRGGERCDNDEACIMPRTFMSAPTGDAMPGMPSCVGACVPKGCAGMGERMCNDHPECNGGSYGTVCRPKSYCVGSTNTDPPMGGDIDGGDESDPALGNSCGCDAEFIACDAQKPDGDVHAERSLLVRDPEIIDDPAFRLDTVLTKLAPAGRVDEFTANFIKQVGTAKSFMNGALANERKGFAQFLDGLKPDTAGVTGRLSGLLHITALVNRLDLAKPGNCGEARLTYALTSAYQNGNQRMTMIVELRVPDDGKNCKSVAQRWAELSLLDSADDRRTRLIALYNELLTPDSVGQIRTNEFLNNTGNEPWELREFHINSATGMLDLVPVAQSVNKDITGNSEFSAWVAKNAADIKAGNAVIPQQFLAAASTEDGGRIRLAQRDTASIDSENALNAQACAGCHLTETKSPFVHIGERLGKALPAGGFAPVGRAVIDSFLQKELVTRSQNLHSVLTATQTLLLTAPRNNQARVH